MGLALSLRLWRGISKKESKQKNQSQFITKMKSTVLTMTFTLAFGQLANFLLAQVPSSTSDELMLFYLATYVLNALLVFSITVIAPYCTQFILHSKDSEKCP